MADRNACSPLGMHPWAPSKQVSRTKARWKVQLKDCIITAHGRDYLVHKANGEMNF